ncbi:hypothetical protein, unknown function [Leishmania tarentolae]|uniref:Uncharacterized protein n=1 Tax=Leishmania tarentolae TaxID=5689 RepID=A0A640KHN2_LEITA|nr:hypothetical protein, unknown function [Leishmania tarentolae]
MSVQRSTAPEKLTGAHATLVADAGDGCAVALGRVGVPPVAGGGRCVLDYSPINQLRRPLYKIHWRDLCGTVAHPTRDLVRSFERSNTGKPVSSSGAAAPPPAVELAPVAVHINTSAAQWHGAARQSCTSSTLTP